MRLPVDAVLLIIEGAGAAEVEALLAVWRDERLPVAHVGDAALAREDETVFAGSTPGVFAGSRLNAALESLGATTLTLCGAGAGVAAAAGDAAALGYRVFVVSESPLPALADVRVVPLGMALAAARQARARERLKAGRARGGA